MTTNAVRESFRRCAALGDEFFDSFYANLVDQETAIGQMFAGTDMQKQNDLIEVGIGHLIAFSAGKSDAEKEIRRLGLTHSRSHLNVQPPYYTLWVESLMNAIREHDPEFSPELEAEWRAVMKPGIDFMISRY